MSRIRKAGQGLLDNHIDNEPTMIHPHCESGCGMNRADPTNQCGDGCILLTVYGQSVGVLNPRVKPQILDQLIEDIYTPNPLWLAGALEWEAKPKWKRAVLSRWYRLADWWCDVKHR